MVIEVVFSDNSPLCQIRQMLEFIRRPTSERPCALVSELAAAPAAFKRVASNALAAGVGWVELTSGDSCLEELRHEFPGLLVTSVTTSEGAIGRLHAEQCRALLPWGGEVLYIEGHGLHSAVTSRRAAFEMGLAGTKLSIGKTLVADWTERTAKAVASRWMQKVSSYLKWPALVCAQNDSMAVGTRRACILQDVQWAGVPVIGCDGLPSGGQRYVREGVLVATVVKPTTAGRGVEVVSQVLKGGGWSPSAVIAPQSYPPVEELRPIAASGSCRLAGH